MIAVFQTGGKQYKVKEGDLICVERDGSSVGEVVFKQVLACGDVGMFKFGKPFLDGVEVVGDFVKLVKEDKVIVFKKKRRHNYRKKKGHRQGMMLVRIKKIG